VVTTGAVRTRILGTTRTLISVGVAVIVLFSFEVAARAQEAPPSTAAPIALQTGSTIQREISGKAVDSYLIALAAGQCAQIRVEQRGIDVFVQVLDSKKKLLAEFDADWRPNGREDVSVASEAAETYEIRVQPRYSRAPGGAYEIRVEELRATSDQDRALYKAHLLSADAVVAKSSSKYDEAIALLEKGIAEAQGAARAGDIYAGLLTIELARNWWTKGDMAKAKPIAERAIEITRQQLGSDDPQTAWAIVTLGIVYRSSDEGAKAEEAIKQAIAITEKSLGADHPKLAEYHSLLGWQYLHRGDYADALSELQLSVAIADKSMGPEDFWWIAVRHNLADFYSTQGDLDRAQPLTEQALAALEKMYGPDSARLVFPLQNLGTIARRRQQYWLALEYLERAEKINEKTRGAQTATTAALLINLGNVYKDEGQFEKADEFFKRALDILEVSSGPYHTLTLDALGALYTLRVVEGKFPEALQYLEQINHAVEKNIELNLAIGSEREKLAFAESIDDQKDEIVSFSLREAPGDKTAAKLAATAVLRRKARVMDSIAGNRATLREHLRPEDEKLIDDLDTATNNLAHAALKGPGKTPTAEYEKQLASLQQRREGIEAEVSTRSAGFYETTREITLAQVQALVPANAALIEFTLYRPYNAKLPLFKDEQFGERRYAALVIPHEGDVYVKDLGSAKEVDKVADALRQSLRDPKRIDEKAAASAAYSKILQPIEGAVGNKSHLILSPDGELQLIPFETLLDSKGRYLVERYSTTYLTTGRDLLRLEVSRPSKNKPLIVADPFFGAPEGEPVIHAKAASASAAPATPAGGARRSITIGQDFSAIYFAPLAGTSLEARSIKGLFPDATVLTGKNVTEAAIKRVEAPDILHIATHGFFLEDSGSGQSDSARSAKSPSNMAPENPLLRSGLALSGANEHKSGDDTGILTALQASGLDLWGTKLVTLSACDTGIGEVRNGEGVYGLRRAFFLAGTQSLVMSLWPVSDAVTREMMVDYYTGLKHGLGRGEALRQAELAMLKRKGRQHPFYWASFIESGEWANLDGKR
jgi:CHAT domain-containing protein/tetratricopeptide (TPR) repeat protein